MKIIKIDPTIKTAKEVKISQKINDENKDDKKNNPYTVRSMLKDLSKWASFVSDIN